GPGDVVVATDECLISLRGNNAGTVVSGLVGDSDESIGGCVAFDRGFHLSRRARDGPAGVGGEVDGDVVSADGDADRLTVRRGIDIANSHRSIVSAQVAGERQVVVSTM